MAAAPRNQRARWNLFSRLLQEGAYPAAVILSQSSEKLGFQLSTVANEHVCRHAKSSTQLADLVVIRAKPRVINQRIRITSGKLSTQPAEIKLQRIKFIDESRPCEMVRQPIEKISVVVLPSCPTWPRVRPEAMRESLWFEHGASPEGG